MSFATNQTQYHQEHFEVIAITLPVITGACTIGGSPGFGTPLTCDQSYTGEEKTYYFTNMNAPVLPNTNNDTKYRAIKSISETPTELKPGEGLASRGSLSVTFVDFTGDPNPLAPGVDDDVKGNGTFFGKLNARQVMVNKEIIVELFTVKADGTIDLVNDGQKRYYEIESFTNNGNGTWTLKAQDELSVANLDNKNWPDGGGGSLRLDIDNSTTSIPVDAATDYSGLASGGYVVVGDEFLTVNSVSNNLTPTATLNVATRGSTITDTGGALITRTDVDSHSAGDEVFICRLSDQEQIDDLLYDVLTESDVPAARIPTTDWANEIAEWHAATTVSTLWYKAEKVNDVLIKILEAYLLDMWFDPVAREIKLSAISVWKESSVQISDTREIEPDTLKIKPIESMRATRALVLYQKKYLARSDDTENFSKASTFKDDSLIVPEFFGEHKDKLFENSVLLDDGSAALLTQRYVSRFKFQPNEYTFKTPERLLSYDTGDIVDIETSEQQGFDGSPQGAVRAQVLSIRPQYRDYGRDYQVRALAYEPAFVDGSEIVITGTLSNVDLYTQYAGAPSSAVDLTFVFDGTITGSTSTGTPSISVGAFPSGSNIIIILVNGADLQGRGGNGASGPPISGSGSNGLSGGTVFDANGVTTDIYFSGATPSASYPTADGYIRAPGGGGASSDGTGASPGNAGGGGAGRNPGTGGAGISSGFDGQDGDTLGNGGLGGQIPVPTIGASGGDWGVAGGNVDGHTGGAAGKGVVDSGGTVTLHGTTAARYINGGGDHP